MTRCICAPEVRAGLPVTCSMMFPINSNAPCRCRPIRSSTSAAGAGKTWAGGTGWRGLRKRTYSTTPDNLIVGADAATPPSPKRLPMGSSLGKYLFGEHLVHHRHVGGVRRVALVERRGRAECARRWCRRSWGSHDPTRARSCCSGRSSSVTPDCQLLPDIGLYSASATLRTPGIWRNWRSISR